MVQIKEEEQAEDKLFAYNQRLLTATFALVVIVKDAFALRVSAHGECIDWWRNEATKSKFAPDALAGENKPRRGAMLRVFVTITKLLGVMGR